MEGTSESQSTTCICKTEAYTAAKFESCRRKAVEIVKSVRLLDLHDQAPTWRPNEEHGRRLGIDCVRALANAYGGKAFASMEATSLAAAALLNKWTHLPIHEPENSKLIDILVDLLHETLLPRAGRTNERGYLRHIPNINNVLAKMLQRKDFLHALYAKGLNKHLIKTVDDLNILAKASPSTVRVLQHRDPHPAAHKFDLFPFTSISALLMIIPRAAHLSKRPSRTFSSVYCSSFSPSASLAWRFLVPPFRWILDSSTTFFRRERQVMLYVGALGGWCVRRHLHQMPRLDGIGDADVIEHTMALVLCCFRMGVVT